MAKHKATTMLLTLVYLGHATSLNAQNNSAASFDLNCGTTSAYYLGKPIILQGGGTWQIRVNMQTYRYCASELGLGGPCAYYGALSGDGTYYGFTIGQVASLRVSRLDATFSAYIISSNQLQAGTQFEGQCSKSRFTGFIEPRTPVKKTPLF
jgi:hypothetical protein